MLSLLGPFDHVYARGRASSVDIDLPRVSGFSALGVYGQDDALVAEAFRALGDQFGMLDPGGVDGDFVRAALDDLRDVFEGADAASHGERNKYLFRHLSYHIHYNGAVVRGGGDVVEYQFVRLLLIVEFGLFHRIAGVHMIYELNPFDDPAAVYVEAGDDAFG